MRSLKTYYLQEDINVKRSLQIPKNFWVIKVRHTGVLELAAITDDQEPSSNLDYVILTENASFDFKSAIYLGSYERSLSPPSDVLTLNGKAYYLATASGISYSSPLIYYVFDITDRDD